MNSSPLVHLESTPKRLRSWFEEKALASVVFKENESPENEPYADYQILYEASFEPASLRQAKIELHITDNQYFGIGIESRQRVAQRLGIRNSRQRYVGGFEPGKQSEVVLFWILETVSTGQLAIRTRTWPLLGLGGTRPVFHRDWIKDAPDMGRRYWFQIVDRLNDHWLRYDPWG